VRLTARGWAVTFAAAFLAGALAPFDALPWNAL
jgi:hypothetical protein